MRLLSCHIAGFGKFANQSFDLSKNPLVIKADNGWGKTTLAAFLESMFFGLDGRSKAVENNDRLKYAPWTGGAFGGTLVFSCAGKTYRIERTFGKTPAMDTARVYDSNNMLCYDFGERAERLGETLFGLDKESYRRCVYVPQGGIETGALPETMKGRLLTVLSSSPQGVNGAQSAIEKLDAAERALRAKRRPAKGKLDEIDERLEYLARQKDECNAAKAESAAAEETLRRCGVRLAELAKELNDVFSKIEESARQSGAAKRETRAETESRLREAERTIAELESFFAGVDPATVNTEGLGGAVTEYYALQEELLALQQKIGEMKTSLIEKQALQAQISATEKTLESYELLKEEVEEKEEEKKKPKKKISKKKRKWAFIGMILFIALTIIGAAVSEANNVLGIILAALGVVGIVVCFFIMLANVPGPKPKPPEKTFKDEAIAAKYGATKIELEDLKRKYANYPADLEAQVQKSENTVAAKTARLNALKTGIENFLRNFRFSATYDYRTALTTVKENAALYLEKARTVAECKERLASSPAEERSGFAYEESVDNLRVRQAELEGERERLTAKRARLGAELESMEKKIALEGEYAAEEAYLAGEKARLEKRYTAIRTAKEILTRAGENMATRYLVPVEKTCKKYGEMLGVEASGKQIRFSADGAPLFEENGSLRVTEYYSEGQKALVGFCVRMALVEEVFKKEPPVLILDDPFTELDDTNAARAKRLLCQLAEKYHVVYFTCKNERTL